MLKTITARAKRYFHGVVFLIIAVLFVWNCSTRKNSFLRRSYHAVTSKFNILYNGTIALEQGEKEVLNKHHDNFWELLPVEPVAIEAKKSMLATVDTSLQDSNFKKAEKKAVKAIQKHSMNIRGRERNPQMGQAYLLLGKARYFDQRYVPALDAFNYLIKRYPAGTLLNEAWLWREKTNIRMKNESEAIENLKRLLKQPKLSDALRSEVAATLGQAYINEKKPDSATKVLRKAVRFAVDKEKKARYKYIEAQLYTERNSADSARSAFDEIIDMKRAPRIYKVNAQIAKARLFDPGKENADELLATLNRLAADRENRPYLDKIYHQIGKTELLVGTLDKAKMYFEKALSKKNKDKFQTSLSYEALGDLYFDESKYQYAGAYYDSTLQLIPTKNKRYRKILRRQESLKDVIRYENIAHATDSILHIVGLSPEERLQFFKEYIQKQKQLKEKQQQYEQPQTDAFVDQEVLQVNPTEGSNWYFYNPVTLAYGKKEFRRLWGNRILEDNWRYGNNTQTSVTATFNKTPEIPKDTLATPQGEWESPEFYISKIPSDKKEIDSITTLRNNTYYRLGLIYEEQFRALALAAERLERLLSFNPESDLILSAEYNLYKIYKAMNSPDSLTYKNLILNDYSKSRYAGIIRNPSELIITKTGEKSSDIAYKKLYDSFEKQRYKSLIKDCETAIRQFSSDSIAPKIALLKAATVGKLDGVKAYKKALDAIAMQYPNYEEGKKARKLAALMKTKIEQGAHFKKKARNGIWKLLIAIPDVEAMQIDTLMAELQQTFASNQLERLTISKDPFDRNTSFIVIHGFYNSATAQAYYRDFIQKKNVLSGQKHFVISSANYQQLQLFKNLEAYATFAKD